MWKLSTGVAPVLLRSRFPAGNKSDVLGTVVQTFLEHGFKNALISINNISVKHCYFKAAGMYFYGQDWG